MVERRLVPHLFNMEALLQRIKQHLICIARGTWDLALLFRLHSAVCGKQRKIGSLQHPNQAVSKGVLEGIVDSAVYKVMLQNNNEKSFIGLQLPCAVSSSETPVYLVGSSQSPKLLGQKCSSVCLKLSPGFKWSLECLSQNQQVLSEVGGSRVPPHLFPVEQMNWLVHAPHKTTTTYPSI